MQKTIHHLLAATTVAWDLRPIGTQAHPGAQARASRVAPAVPVPVVRSPRDDRPALDRAR